MLNWLPETISSFGKEIDEVFKLIYYVVGAWFLLAEGLLIYFVIRYRRREGVKAVYSNGTTPKALAWVVVPVVLVLCFDLIFDVKATPIWEKVKIDMPTDEEADVIVRVEARQFAWNFRHAGADKKLNTVDDIVTNGRLYVPVGKKVKFELVAADVIHAFWVPALRLKQDAIPGRVIYGWFDTDKVGEYPIACSEICGNGHSFMQARLFVMSQADYAKALETKAFSVEAAPSTQPAK